MPNIDKETHFVMRGGAATFPEATKDGLLTWYDTKGKHNPDRHKDTLLDLSGNNRNAQLYNFAYEKKSGYLETPEGGLLFDDVDDKLVYPSVKGEVEHTSASRNLFDGTFEYGSFNFATGVMGGDSTMVRTNPIKGLIPSKTYTISHSEDSIFEVAWGTWRSDGSFIEGGRTLTEKYINITLPHDTESLRFRFLNSNLNIKAQLEEGSAATPYTPYVPLPVMTYQYNGNILSYEADGTVRRVDDGKVIERKGINLVRNGNFADGVKRWFTSSGTSEMRCSDTGGVELSLLNNLATHARISQDLSINSSIGTALYFKIKVTTLSENINHCRVFLRDGTGGSVIANRTSQIYNQVMGQTYELEAIAVNDAELVNNTIYVMADFYRKGDTTEKLSIRIEDIQVINLTEAYGVGNEPTLEYIQAHPEEFAWTPNPNDLIEAHEIKNNLVGDLEDLHGTGDKTEILSGVGEVFTDQADDDSVVHLELEGKSVQPHSFREESGESLVLTNHAEDKPRKLEVLGNTFQNAGSGKNLFNLQELRTLTLESWVVSAYVYRFKLKPNTNYTLSSNVPTAGDANKTVLYFNGSGTKENGVWLNVPKTTTSDGEGNLYIAIPPSREHSLPILNGNYWVQLEEGSTATAYEPPAPSPDYPIEMKSVEEGLELYSGTGGVNLFTDYHFDSGVDDWRFVNATGTRENSVLKLSATGSNPSSTRFEKSLILKGDTYYTLTVRARANTGLRFRSFVNAEYTEPPAIGGDNEWVVSSITFKSLNSKENTVLRIYLNDGSVGKEAELDWAKLEEGVLSTNPTPAPRSVPLNTTQNGVFRTKPNLTAPLRKVGDVADRLFWDATARKWKVERRVGEDILDSNRNWSEYGIGTRDTIWGFYASLSSTPLQSTTTYDFAKSTHFVQRQRSGVGSNLNSNIGFYIGTGTTIYILVDRSLMPSGQVDEFKTWLNANSVTIQYQLETPVIETLEGGQLPPLLSPNTYLDTISEVKGQLTAGYRLKEGATPEDSDILVAPEYVNPIHSTGEYNLFDPLTSSVGYVSTALASWIIQGKPNTSYTLTTTAPRHSGSTFNVFFGKKGESASSSTNGVAINEPRTLITGSDGLMEITTRAAGSIYSTNIDTIKSGNTKIWVTQTEKLAAIGVVSSMGRRNLLSDRFLMESTTSNGNEFIVPETLTRVTILNGEHSNMVLPAGMYTFSFNMKATGNGRVNGVRLARKYVSSSGGFGSIVYMGSTGSVIASGKWETITYQWEAMEPVMFMLQVYNDYNNLLHIKDLKIERGINQTIYAPSPEDIQSDTFTPTLYKTNFFLSEPLRSVGDMKDRLFRDSDGLWKIERKVAMYTFTGAVSVMNASKSWPELGRTTFNIRGFTNQSLQKDGTFMRNNESTNSHFEIIQSSYDRGSIGQGGSSGKHGMYLTVPNYIASTVPELISWLETEHQKGSPLTVQFLLESPAIETLPQADQDKLNNIATYSGSNYVYTVLPDKDAALAEQLQPTIHSKFRKLSWFWSRLLFNQLKIWKRNLTDSELLHEWKQNKKRWGM